MNKPPLFTYDNYRIYLKDWFQWMKETRPEFSHRAFSRWAGFKSPNQLLLVIHGKRNIPLASLNQYFKVLKFGETEKKYFELLVKFNQAKEMTSKTEYFRQLSVYWLRKGTLLQKEQYKYLSYWFYPAIRELVNLKDFQEDGGWISRRLGRLVSPAQSRQAIEILLRLKLLDRDPKGGLIQTFQFVTTGDEVGSVAAYLYHEQMMKLALESLKLKPSSERNMTALTFTIRKEDYEPIVSEINDARKRIIAALQNREIQDKDTDLYQLTFHLFPISREG